MERDREREICLPETRPTVFFLIVCVRLLNSLGLVIYVLLFKRIIFQPQIYFILIAICGIKSIRTS